MLYFLFIYLGFLLIVSSIFYLVNNKFRHIVLFIASLGLITYISWKVALFAILFSTINFFLGILIEKKRTNPTLRRRIFWTAIVLDIGILSFFKYLVLLDEEIIALVKLFSANSSLSISAIIIPLGISYYTFQALGYIIRINRGSEKPEIDYFKFVTYLIFFPKFFSGPVERSNHFFPQIKIFGDFMKENVFDGLRLLLWGAFKKFVIASSFYLPIHQVYSNVSDYNCISLLSVLFLQTIYIYMEFSGYTDMAIGSAKIFGINLIDNFNRPFLARNISEFWRRWHISLSSWCNDFIYSPFIVKYRKYENFAIVTGVFITFFIIGVWHAANWTFVILGLLQCIAIVYEFYTKKSRLNLASRFPKSLVNAFSRIIVFLFVSISMIFFFSQSISDAWHFLSHLFDFNSSNITDSLIISNKLAFGLSFLAFTFILIAEMLNEKGKNLLSFFLKQPVWLRFAGYAVLIAAICFSNSEFLPFEYMKF